jgi:hypothetical protein
LRAGKGVLSANQLTFRLWFHLQERKTVREVVDEQVASTQYPKSPDEAVGEFLDFTRNWAQFTLPRVIRATDDIARNVFEQVGLPAGNFSSYAAIVEGLFRPATFGALQEFGAPLPMLDRLQGDRSLDFDKPLAEVMDMLRWKLAKNSLQIEEFEAQLLEHALQ